MLFPPHLQNEMYVHIESCDCCDEILPSGKPCSECKKAYCTNCENRSICPFCNMKVERHQRKWEQHVKNVNYQNERLETLINWNVHHPESEVYLDNAIQNAMFGYTFENYLDKNKKKDILLRFDRFHNIIPSVDSKVDAFYRRRKFYDNNPTKISRAKRQRVRSRSPRARFVKMKRRNMRSTSPPSRSTPSIYTPPARSVTPSLPIDFPGWARSFGAAPNERAQTAKSSPPTRSVSKELYTISLSTTRDSEEEENSKEFSRTISFDYVKDVGPNHQLKNIGYTNTQIQKLYNSKNIVNINAQDEKNKRNDIKNRNITDEINIIPQNWSPKNIIALTPTKTRHKWKSNENINISNYDSNGRLNKYRYRKAMRETSNHEMNMNKNFEVDKNSPNFDTTYPEHYGTNMV